MSLSCEQPHPFKKLEDQKVVFIPLATYNLDSIPPQIAQLKKVEELTVSLDSSMGWTIYPPLSANLERISKPPYKTLPDEIGDLSFLKKLDISGLNLKSLPPSFKKLQNLEHVNLAMNKLDIAKELPMLLSLPKLKVLSVEGNKVDTRRIREWKTTYPDIDIKW